LPCSSPLLLPHRDLGPPINACGSRLSPRSTLRDAANRSLPRPTHRLFCDSGRNPALTPFDVDDRHPCSTCHTSVTERIPAGLAIRTAADQPLVERPVVRAVPMGVSVESGDPFPCQQNAACSRASSPERVVSGVHGRPLSGTCRVCRVHGHRCRGAADTVEAGVEFAEFAGAARRG